MDQARKAPDTILFVDDEASILSALRRELHGWAIARSLRLEAAASAREALEFLEARADDIAVLVSDLKMPGMLGSDFLLLAKERWPGIVTILLTGFSEAEEVMKAVKAGIFSYILKPWEPGYLRSELEKALDIQAMQKERAERLRSMEEELRWAGEMQRALLRPRIESVEGLEFISSYEPLAGLYCSGDYYDLVSLGPGRYLALLGDVAGHGLRAAFVTGILRAVIYPEYVRALGGRRLSPSAFLGWLNDRMDFELRPASDLVITFLAGLIDVNEMSFTYANAGHNHPLLLRQGEVRDLGLSGPGIGIAGSLRYEETAERLESGDIIALYTDGLAEAGAKEGTNPVVDVPALVAGTAWGPDWPKRLMAAALEASGAPGFEDDVTILGARIP